MLLVKSKELRNSVNILFRPLVGGLSLVTTPVFAESATPTTASSFVSILLSLIVVLAIIFSIGFLMRRFNVTHTGSHQMKIVSSMMLGNRERVMLIQVGEEQHLLGVTAQQINHLSKLEKPVEIEEGAESFKSKLGQLMKNNKETSHD